MPRGIRVNPDRPQDQTGGDAVRPQRRGLRVMIDGNKQVVAAILENWRGAQNRSIARAEACQDSPGSRRRDRARSAGRWRRAHRARVRAHRLQLGLARDFRRSSCRRCKSTSLPATVTQPWSVRADHRREHRHRRNRQRVPADWPAAKRPMPRCPDVESRTARDDFSAPKQRESFR